MNNLGVLLAKRGDTDTAEQLYRKAADLGNANGMNNLGVGQAGRTDQHRPARSHH